MPRWSALSLPAPVLATVLLTTATALADDTNPDYIPEDVEGVEPEKPTGFNPRLTASANLNFSHSNNVVGVDNGLTFNGGFLIDGGFYLLGDKRQHEWISSLTWGLGYTRTPSLPVFLKSLDALDVDTMYLWHTPKAPWFGPFAELRLTSSLFPGKTYSATELETVRLDADGNEVSRETVDALEPVELTRSLAPTTLRESVGAFATPLEKTRIRLEIRAGIGAWESFVRDGYLVADDEETDSLELQQMQDSVQVGAELNVAATGAINDAVTYSVFGAVMQPFAHNAETDLTGIQLMNVEAGLGIGVQLWQWASLQYQFSATRIPLVYDGWQVTNGLLLSFNLNLVKERPPVEETAEAGEAEETAAEETAAEAVKKAADQEADAEETAAEAVEEAADQEADAGDTADGSQDPSTETAGDTATQE